MRYKKLLPFGQLCTDINMDICIQRACVKGWLSAFQFKLNDSYDCLNFLVYVSWLSRWIVTYFRRQGVNVTQSGFSRPGDTRRVVESFPHVIY